MSKAGGFEKWKTSVLIQNVDRCPGPENLANALYVSLPIASAKDREGSGMEISVRSNCK